MFLVTTIFTSITVRGKPKEALEEVGITLLGLDKPSVTLSNGMTMLGLPYVINLPFWAFNRTEEEIAAKLEIAGYHDIVAAHSPQKESWMAPLWDQRIA